MLNLLRPKMIGRWLLALALAGCYVCVGGCWHHEHDRGYDGGYDRGYDHHDHDYHDHDRDYHDHDRY